MQNKTVSYSRYLGQWQRLRPHAQLSIPEILNWVDVYYHRHGRWPQAKSGKVRGSLAEFWSRVDDALRIGRRGLEGGSSLAKLLWEKRGVRNIYSKPRLNVPQILAWADAHHARTGKWPTLSNGAIRDARQESWMNVSVALSVGLRGLKGGSSLAKLLEKERGVRNPANVPRLKVSDILTWADAYHQRTGKWPTENSGPIPEALPDTWQIVDGAMRKGRRGFPGGSSLARFLVKHRGKRHHLDRPPLTVDQLLQWADRWHERTGTWPGQRDTEPIPEVPSERWLNINRDLRLGLRGLPRTTLRQLLAKHRGIPHLHEKPPLTEKEILRWADAHHKATGQWPRSRSGPIHSAAHETWAGLDGAFRSGRRSLQGRSTLSEFLAKHRGVPLFERRPKPLTVKQILAWADAHHRRTGQWPDLKSGLIADTLAERWSNIDRSLKQGLRGLPRGQSLRDFLGEHRGVRNAKFPPALTVEQILVWADAHKKRKGRWPTHKSGPIPEMPDERWSTVNAALIQRRRGLRSGMSLAKFLARHRDAPYRHEKRQLTIAMILYWLDGYRTRTGKWPTHAQYGESVPEAPELNWRMIDRALKAGHRGLPGQMTLCHLMAKHRGVRTKLSLPRLSEAQILLWADEHHRKTGKWPKTTSGREVLSAVHENWSAIDLALRNGLRGLPGGNSLAGLLLKQRNVAHHLARPHFTIQQILCWADAFKRRTGNWPTADSGDIPEATNDHWNNVESALRVGLRGLPGRQTLARVLAEHRGKRSRFKPPPLKLKQIVGWAKDHFDKHGRWPTRADGTIAAAPGETWNGIRIALLRGRRGLPGGASLTKLVSGISANHSTGRR